LNKLVKEKFTRAILSNKININQNLIAMQLFQSEPMLVIMNHELEIIKQIPFESFKGSDESFIYVCDRPTGQDLQNRFCFNIKVVDWSLETVKILNFQIRNRNEPFFHDIQDPWGIFFSNFKSIKNYYVLEILKFIFVYNQNGVLIRKIETDHEPEHLDSMLSHKECITLIKKNKLNHYDLKGKIIKETNLINIKFKKRNTNFQVKFNSNNDVIIFDAYSDKLYL